MDSIAILVLSHLKGQTQHRGTVPSLLPQFAVAALRYCTCLGFANVLLFLIPSFLGRRCVTKHRVSAFAPPALAEQIRWERTLEAGKQKKIWAWGLFFFHHFK